MSIICNAHWIFDNFRVTLIRAMPGTRKRMLTVTARHETGTPRVAYY